MLRLLAAVVALAPLTLAPARAQEGKAPGAEILPGGVRIADALYPCRPAPNVLRYFHLETDAPELAKVNPALAELGAELAYGPRTTSGRPGHAFVVVRAPRGADPKKLAGALKKGGGKAEPLTGIAFDGRTGEDHDFGLGGLGVTKRDFAMGMAGGIVWYDAFGPWSQAFGAPGKLKPAELVERYAKLYEPYGGARLGELVKERFRWTLARAPEDAVKAKVLSVMEKTPGIEGAVIEGTFLTVTVALKGLETGGDVGPMPSTAGEPLDAAGGAAPRVAFDAGALYELLKAQELVP
jgi:hypothetical protein